MKRILIFASLLMPFFVLAQDMRVYTVAGSSTATDLGDSGPATAARLEATEGIWIDGACNLYISDLVGRIRKVDLLTGIITTVAGNGIGGNTGDGGQATNAQIKGPYGLYADIAGNVYLSDINNNNVRKITASTGIITTIAGDGVSLGDGGPATNALVNLPQNVYGDIHDNIYISERGRIRKISAATGIITTVAGNGISGLSGDGGPATNAQISGTVAGMQFDNFGNLLVADRGNHRIRKITPSGIITTIAGTNEGYSGDGGAATNAQFSGIISFAVDNAGNIIIGDNVNDRIRKVDATTGVVTSIAGVGPTSGSNAEGALAINTYMHPEFLYLDLAGNLYFSNFGNKVRKITGLLPGLAGGGSNCIKTEVELSQENIQTTLYPNPCSEFLNIDVNLIGGKFIIHNMLGQQMDEESLKKSHNTIDVSQFPAGAYVLKIFNSNSINIFKFLKK